MCFSTSPFDDIRSEPKYMAAARLSQQMQDSSKDSYMDEGVEEQTE
jgi:hypothetical protein